MNGIHQKPWLEVERKKKFAKDCVDKEPRALARPREYKADEMGTASSTSLYHNDIPYGDTTTALIKPKCMRKARRAQG